MPVGAKGRLAIIAGSSNLELTTEVAKNLGVSLEKVKLFKFPNGEVYAKFEESVRGADVFILQTLYNKINDKLMELLVMINALKRASAGRINVVLPYYAHSRQDRKAAGREPITAKLVADLLTVAGQPECYR